MEAKIQKDYVTPGNPVAFSGFETVKRHYKNEKLSDKVIKRALSGINSYVLHRETKSLQTNPFFISSRRQQIQVQINVLLILFMDFITNIIISFLD